MLGRRASRFHVQDQVDPALAIKIDLFRPMTPGAAKPDPGETAGEFAAGGVIHCEFDEFDSIEHRRRRKIARAGLGLHVYEGAQGIARGQAGGHGAEFVVEDFQGLRPFVAAGEGGTQKTRYVQRPGGKLRKWRLQDSGSLLMRGASASWTKKTFSAGRDAMAAKSSSNTRVWKLSRMSPSAGCSARCTMSPPGAIG